MSRLPLTILLAALALLVIPPTAAQACSSDNPTFRQAVHGARAIARVTIVDGFDIGTSDPETYRVERVLKGSLPAMVTLADPRTSLCDDSIGWYAGPEGRTAIIAFDMPYYDQVINPVWTRDPNAGGPGSPGVTGSASAPRGVRTLRELEAAILAELGAPDTAAAPTSPDRRPLPLVLLAAAALGIAVAAMTIRRTTRRRT